MESEAVNPSTIEQVEKEATERASHAISVLEDALTSWESSTKPEHLRQKFIKYRHVCAALKAWKSGPPGKDYESRVRRLREFVDICHGLK